MDSNRKFTSEKIVINKTLHSVEYNSNAVIVVVCVLIIVLIICVTFIIAVYKPEDAARVLESLSKVIKSFYKISGEPKSNNKTDL